MLMLRKLLAPAVIAMNVDDPNIKLYSPNIHPYKLTFTVSGIDERDRFNPRISEPIILITCGKSIEVLEKYAGKRRRIWIGRFKEYKIFNPDGTVAVHVTK